MIAEDGAEFPAFSIVDTSGALTSVKDLPLDQQVRMIEFTYGAGGCWVPSHGVTVWCNGREERTKIRYEGLSFMLGMIIRQGGITFGTGWMYWSIGLGVAWMVFLGWLSSRQRLKERE